jgi:FMN-dependent NADH-azoreductase
MNILHLDSSILGDLSISRSLSAGIVDRLKVLHPDATVTHHDLNVEAPQHLSDRHLAVALGQFVPDIALGEDLARGNAYMDEVFAADIIVIGAPMYNFGISSQLKAWIDRVVVAGKTFKYDENGVEGLVKGKRVFLAASRGGFYLGDSPYAFLEHQESYLTGMLGFIGLTDITTIRVEGSNLGPETKAQELEKAQAEIAALAA